MCETTNVVEPPRPLGEVLEIYGLLGEVSMKERFTVEVMIRGKTYPICEVIVYSDEYQVGEICSGESGDPYIDLTKKAFKEIKANSRLRLKRTEKQRLSDNLTKYYKLYPLK